MKKPLSPGARERGPNGPLPAGTGWPIIGGEEAGESVGSRIESGAAGWLQGVSAWLVRRS